jgi:NADH-quinone oxidoreductase subunit J
MNLYAFVFIAILTLAAALAAALLPGLIHSALSLAVAFLGLAAFYILLGAEFVGLVQVLVYVGAVAVLVVFTILLTQRDDEKPAGIHLAGVVVAVAVFSSLLWAVMNSRLPASATTAKTLTVAEVGGKLMTDYVWPLQCVGLVLTVALLGALVLVMEEKR